MKTIKNINNLIDEIELNLMTNLPFFDYKITLSPEEPPSLKWKLMVRADLHQKYHSQVNKNFVVLKMHISQSDPGLCGDEIRKFFEDGKKYKEVISDILDHISPFVGLCYGVGFDAGESSKDCIMKLSQKIHQIVTETENRYESDGVSNIFESQIVLNKLIEAEMWAEKIEDYPTINNKRYPKA